MNKSLILFYLLIFSSFLSYSQIQDGVLEDTPREWEEQEWEGYTSNDCPTIPPEYPGGDSALLNYIMKNIKLPVQDEKHSIEGTVYVRLTIDEDGYATNPEVAKSLHPLIDKEAIRVISTLDRWKPAERCGRAVDAPLILPIRIISY
ncbi:MAG: energy transducer TonB [Bacteroidia bacterium]